MDIQSKIYQNHVRTLNDQFRHLGVGQGSFTLTEGISEKGAAFVHGVITTVRNFSAFSSDNDPHNEHDFGAFQYEGEKLFFKIDYYDLSLKAHSPNAADPKQTHRVLTVMLASEY